MRRSQTKRFIPASAGIRWGGSTWSGHSGGCFSRALNVLETCRMERPWASRMSRVTSSVGLSFNA